MEVRKFEAFSMNDAIRLVKKELGKDAVILSTREKESLAAEGERPLKVVEVVAASAASLKESTQAATLAGGMAGQEVRKDRVQSAKAAQGGFASIHRGEAGARARTVEFPRVSKPNETTIVKGSPTLSTLSATTKQTFRDTPRPTLEAPTPAFLSQANPQTNANQNRLPTHEVQDIREELIRVRRDLETLPQVNVGEQMQEIKVLLHDLMRNRSQQEESRFHEYLSDISVRLRAAGVKEAIISETLQTVCGLDKPLTSEGKPLEGQKLREFFLAQTIKTLFRQLHVTGHWRFENRQTTLVCFVGPTGVGKTTTLAKLAARLKLTDGKSVALASMDTFRIGGADQLRVYSKILDCPFGEFSEPQELVEFVSKQHQAQVILLDTAGRNARQQSQMESLARLSGTDIPLHFHLVLSATMKQRDLDENLKAYCILNPESLIFTKLDESWSYGEILNCAAASRSKLSYFTTGQKVPEDLEPATKERVVERLFRL